MNRLLIVDGSNLLFQMFFGMPARIVNDQGKGIWGTLENILAHADRIKKPSVRESIIRNSEKLKVNDKLINLGNHFPVPFVLQELEYAGTDFTTNEVLKGIGVK